MAEGLNLTLRLGLARCLEGRPLSMESDYWSGRRDSIYYFVTRQICQRFCPHPASVIDVGSNNTPILEWYRDRAQRLVSLDLLQPYRAEGVEAIQTDFLGYRPAQKYSLAICLQVLEHVAEAAAFAQKILEIADLAVVSVPYRWPAGTCEGHIHDPVDERKLLSWFGRPPGYKYVAVELDGTPRIIQVYRGAPQNAA